MLLSKSTKPYQPHQYEIWVASLDKTKGSEMQKNRPVVVVSPDSMNQYLSTVVVCPLTSPSSVISMRRQKSEAAPRAASMGAALSWPQ